MILPLLLYILVFRGNDAADEVIFGWKSGNAPEAESLDPFTMTFYWGTSMYQCEVTPAETSTIYSCDSRDYSTKECFAPSTAQYGIQISNPLNDAAQIEQLYVTINGVETAPDVADEWVGTTGYHYRYYDFIGPDLSNAPTLISGTAQSDIATCDERKKCKLEIVGLNHDEHTDTIGQYFAFDLSTAECILGSDVEGVHNVVYSGTNEERSVQMWTAMRVTPCPSGNCGHGRKENSRADGDWEKGKWIELKDVECSAECLDLIYGTSSPSKYPTIAPTEGPDLPIPGEVYNITNVTGNVTGHFTLNEKTNYVNPTHTTECNFEIEEFNNEKQLSSTSYVTITKEIYDASSDTYTNNSFLIMTEEVVRSSLLPPNCGKYPALKITSVEINPHTVKLFVQQAAFYEYIDEMDVTATHLPLMDDGEEAPMFTPNPDDIMNNNANITNITVIIEEAVCAEYDENDTFIGDTQPDNDTFIGDTPPVDDECGNATVADEFGGENTGGFNEPSERRRSRRLLRRGRRRRKRWRKRLKKIGKKLLKVVESVPQLNEYVAYVKTIISLLTGKVHETLQKGIGIESSIMYKVVGSQEIKTKKSKKESDNPLSVTVDGDFTIDTGVAFSFLAYVDFRAKYKLFSKKPSFDLLKLVIGAEAKFQTWFTVSLNGGIHISYEVVNKEKEKIFFIGPVPIVLKVYGSITLGLSIDLTLSLYAKFGFEPIYIEFGIEWKKKGGWKQIFDNQLRLIPINEYGGDIGDSGSCLDFTIEPSITLQFGIVFYKIVDVYLLGTFGLPVGLIWPGSCDDAKTPCDYGNNYKLKFDVGLNIDLSIGTVIGSSDIDLTAFEAEVSLFSYSTSLFARCVPLSLPFLNDICCFNGEVVPLPPTAPCRLEIVGLDHEDHTDTIGQYFAFDLPTAVCILGSESDVDGVHDVVYSGTNQDRTVRMWPSKKVTPCPSGNCGHGRKSESRADGDWEKGEWIEFKDVECSADCFSAKAVSYNVDTHPDQSIPYHRISYAFILIGLIAICCIFGVKKQNLKYAAVHHHVNDVVMDTEDECTQSEEEPLYL